MEIIEGRRRGSIMTFMKVLNRHLRKRIILTDINTDIIITTTTEDLTIGMITKRTNIIIVKNNEEIDTMKTTKMMIQTLRMIIIDTS